ncbi:MAG: hypothetical protein JWM99_2539 [Verrucomicrobiales bacterium]|nr:hypothetical protein [Verrucomicrobiales bacterium]
MCHSGPYVRAVFSPFNRHRDGRYLYGARSRLTTPIGAPAHNGRRLQREFDGRVLQRTVSLDSLVILTSSSPEESVKNKSVAISVGHPFILIRRRDRL